MPLIALMQYSAPSDVPLPPGTNSRDFWINLLDSRPNHIHLAADSASSLRISDGVIVVVDCLECIPFQTESLIWKALAEGVKPVLVLNNVDRLIELKKEEDPEEVFRTLSRSIDGLNCIISTFVDSPSVIGGDGDSWALSPEKGNVVFASSREGWAFTIGHFARIHAPRFGLDPEQMTHRLWGENYYDPVARKWKTDQSGEGGKPLPRFFTQFIIEPMCKLRSSLMAGDLTKV
ncbi:elongation factor 2 [Pelomyxa schiedti]|nr:elongation factor 2 [Pelomyxa schiedti]